MGGTLSLASTSGLLGLCGQGHCLSDRHKRTSDLLGIFEDLWEDLVLQHI